MEKIELVLKNDKRKSYHLLFLLFLYLNLGFLLAYAYRNDTRSGWIIAITCTVLTAGILIIGNKNGTILRAEKSRLLAPLVIAVAFLAMGIWWAVAALALLTALYLLSIRELTVIVTENEIVYPSFPTRHIEWMDLNNIILKDGILTLDFKSNKIAQSELAADGKDYAAREQEFNEFCRIQLLDQQTKKTD